MLQLEKCCFSFLITCKELILCVLPADYLIVCFLIFVLLPNTKGIILNLK